MSAVGRLCPVLACAVGRTFRAAVSLDAHQRQALMTWGLLGGVIALTGLLWWLLGSAEAHWRADLPTELQARYIDGLFTIAKLLVGLMALLAFGVVAIARGGALTLKFTREGVEVEASASGGAARALAKETSIYPEGGTS